MKILSILAIIFGFSQCGSLKLEDNPPFKITSAVYTNLSGGQPGVKGIDVQIIYTSKNVIEFDSIYFAKRIAKLEVNKIDAQKMIIGHFNTSTIKRDIVLDSNPTKEINNEVPEIKKFPFELNENEAIISYKIKGKTKYFKIKSVKRGKPIFYPSAPKQK
jgi:hypothetical protein